MKHLLIVFCITLSNFISWGNEKIEIELEKSHIGHENDRSISIDPTASYDNNFAYFYSDIPLRKLQVSIKNKNGEIFISDAITILPKQPASIFIGNLENGTYILELNDGKHEYWGYFDVK